MKSRLDKLQHLLSSLRPMKFFIAVNEGHDEWRIDDEHLVFKDESALDEFIKHNDANVVKLRVIS